MGYARAVQAGDIVGVSGTTGTDPSGKVLAPGDMYAQNVQTIRNIENALKHLGLGPEHVVRTRIDVTKLIAGRKSRPLEIFGEVHPATRLVGVARLIDPKCCP